MTIECWACTREFRRRTPNGRYCTPRCARRASRARHRYGLTPEQFREMNQARSGLCALCGRREQLGVDHDHATGRIRLLLCNDCNLGLGRFRDDPELMRRAANYVEHFRSDRRLGA